MNRTATFFGVAMIIGSALQLSPGRATAQSASGGAGRTPPPFARAVLANVIVSKPAAIKGGDWDDKMQKVAVRLKFTNQDIHQTYEGYTAMLSVLGQCVIDGKVKKVLLQEEVKISLPPSKGQEHECKTVTTRFDKTGVRFGYFYDGWVLVVKNAEGKVVHVKSTVPNYEKMPEPASLLAMGRCYSSSKLQPVGDPER